MRSAALILVALVAALGCAARKPASHGLDPEPALTQEDGARLDGLFKARTGANAVDYCLGPGDLLTVNVFGWEAMRDQQVRVSASGNVTLPMLGDVPAAGRTETQLRDELERRLRSGYMRDPHVTVFVQRFQSQQVSVTGAVARPGLYSLTRDNRTIYDMLSQAGGLTEQAGGRVLFTPGADTRCGASVPTSGAGLRRATGANGIAPIEFEIDASAADGRRDPLTLPVMGGDSLVVSRGRFMVDGWVSRPGLYSFTPGMTAHGAMSIAGGTLFPANLRHTQIIRARRDGTKEVLEVDLKAVGAGEARDVSLREGDVIRFNASAVKMVPYSVYWVFENLFRVGAGISVAGV